MTDQPWTPEYVLNVYTNVVHKATCGRAPDGLPWPMWGRKDVSRRACSYCLPDGLPKVGDVDE